MSSQKGTLGALRPCRGHCACTGMERGKENENDAAGAAAADAVTVAPLASALL